MICLFVPEKPKKLSKERELRDPVKYSIPANRGIVAEGLKARRPTHASSVLSFISNPATDITPNATHGGFGHTVRHIKVELKSLS